MTRQGKDDLGGFDDYVAIRTADQATVERLGSALERRTQTPEQQGLLAAWLERLEMPGKGRVLEVGCGTGAVLRVLAARAGARLVVGLDPSHPFLLRARANAPSEPRTVLLEAEAGRLPFPDRVFDLVVFCTTLCHLTEPAAALVEAYRTLRRRGQVAVLEADRPGITATAGADDPVEACVRAGAVAASPWVAGRLERLAGEAGFEVVALRHHPYYESDAPGYMLSIIDRGADRLAASGRIGSELASALKAEARRRVAQGVFRGSIPYVSVIGRRP